MKKSGVVQLNVRVPEDIAERLRILAALSGETQAELVILALQDYLDKHNDLIRNFLALQARFAGGRAHSDGTGQDAPADKTAAAQAPGSEAQGAQAEAAQAPVPAEPAQTEQEQTADMPQASPVPSDSGQVASSSPVDMQQAADAQAPVPAMQDVQDTEQADMQESADAAEAGDSSQDMQDGSSMTEQLGQDALQISSPAGSGPGTQNTAQGSEQDAPTDATTAQGLPVQGSLLASLRRMVRENAAKDALQDAGQDEEAAGPSIEELKARARELKAQGLTQSQIAREIGKSEASVSRYLKSAK